MGIPASETTPESIFLNRRAFVAGSAAALTAVALPRRARADSPDPTAALYPAKRNPAYALDREVTPEAVNLHYNNFYEFTTSKHVDADALKTRPWAVTIDGLVEKNETIDVDDLVKAIGLEERLYRHRCVEAWSMAIPWTGFPLRALVERAKPLSAAKYVRFETFLDDSVAPGQRQFMPWPYVEGLTIAEATNDLAFIVTGAYGKPVAKVQGRRSVWRRRGSTDSSRRNRSSRSASSPTGRRPSGSSSARTNTASGPTSIRTCRIRAGARRERRS